MLATDPHLDLGTRGPALVDGDPHQPQAVVAHMKSLLKPRHYMVAVEPLPHNIGEVEAALGLLIRGILAASDGHDLVVVGNRGMTGAGRFFVGGVPNKVSHHARTDLLIVNTTGETAS